MNQKILVDSGIIKVIEGIQSKSMRSLKDLCQPNSSSLDGYFRVIVRDKTRCPSYKPYKYADFVAIEDRILFPGDKLLNKKGKITKRKVIAFDTYNECQNIIDAYKSPLMVGFQQKVWVNRHTPLDFTPAFDGDFTKSWSYSAIQQSLGLTTEEVKQMEWDNNFENPLLSIVGDKETGIRCTSIADTDNSEQVIALDNKQSVKKFSANRYRRQKCENIEDLHQLQSYVTEEAYSVLEYVLNRIYGQKRELTYDEAIALVMRRLNVKFKQQERRFKSESVTKDDENIVESTQVEKSTIENDVQIVDYDLVEVCAKTDVTPGAKNNHLTKCSLFVNKQAASIQMSWHKESRFIGCWIQTVCTILVSAQRTKFYRICTPLTKLGTRGPPQTIFEARGLPQIH